MSLDSCLQSALSRVGRTVVLQKGGDPEQTRQVNAYLQPIRYQSAQTLSDAYFPAGMVDTSGYEYISSPLPDDFPLEQGDLVISKEQQFYVVKVRQFYFGQRPFYLWALLRKAEEE